MKSPFKKPNNGLKVKQNSKKKKIKKSGYDLLDAYNLLGLETYPVTYEEIREGYYKNIIGHDGDDNYKKPYLDARELIFNNMSINPFKEIESMTLFYGDDEEIKEKTSLKDKFKLPKKEKKETFKDLIGDPSQDISKKDETPKKKYKINIWGSIRLTAILLIVSILISNLVSGKPLFGSRHTKVKTTKTETVNTVPTTSGDAITYDLSKQLLIRDGITCKDGLITCNTDYISDLKSKEGKILSIFNIYSFKRQFRIYTNDGVIEIKGTSFYKRKEMLEGIDDYTKLKDFAKVSFVKANINGEYDGHINGKAVHGSLTSTDNGYVTGELNITSHNKVAKCTVYGKFNLDKAELELITDEWIERPNLFPNVDYVLTYNYSLGGFIEKEDKKTKGMNFTKSKYYAENQEPFKNAIRCSSAKIDDSDVELTLSEITFDTFEVSNVDTTYTIKYTGILKNEIASYLASGTALFDTSGTIPKMNSNNAVLRLNKIDLNGFLYGTETDDDKITWDVTYEILDCDDNVYKAAYSAKSSLKKKEEIRSIILNEDGTLTIKREDVLSNKAYSFKDIILSYDRVTTELKNTNVVLHR